MKSMYISFSALSISMCNHTVQNHRYSHWPTVNELPSKLMTQSSPRVKWHTKATACVKLWCRQFCPRVSYLVPAWGCVSLSDNFLRNESSERVVRQKFARTRWRQFCQLPITMCLMWWPTFVWFQDRSATFSRSKIFTHLDFVTIINDNHYKTMNDWLLCFMSINLIGPWTKL